jgi:hypothetical protein
MMSKKNIPHFPGSGGYFFPIRVLTLNHSQTNTLQMNKLLVVFAIGAFAACNGSASTDAKIDSTASVAKDSVTAVVDSAKAVIDSAATAAKDSIKAKVDSLKK